MRGARAASCSCSFIVWQQTNQDQKLSRRDGASHLSLLVQRNLAQRKHTPPSRPVLRTGFAEPAGFSERASCPRGKRSEEHTSELQSLMRISYAVFCLKQKKQPNSSATWHTYTSQHHTPYLQQHTLTPISHTCII